MCISCNPRWCSLSPDNTGVLHHQLVLQDTHFFKKKILPLWYYHLTCFAAEVPGIDVIHPGNMIPKMLVDFLIHSSS